MTKRIEPAHQHQGTTPDKSLLLDKEETRRIQFRKIALSDYPEWLEFFRDPSSFKHWMEDRETPEIECEKWYRRQFQRYETNEGGTNALVEKSTGKLIGHCGLLVQQVDGLTELEIGYSILPRFRGMGLAYEAALKCRDYAFVHQLAASLISIISLTNTPSQSVATRNGMRADKVTVYKSNKVMIYRIKREDWLRQS